MHQNQTSGFSFRTTTLSLGMVKSRYRPSPLEWSNQHCIETLSMGLVIDSFAIKALCKAMVIDFLVASRALCEAMVIDFFTSRPSSLEWSLILFVTSRPSPWDWSSIPSHQGPLQSNGRWFLYYIKPLCKAMVVDFLVASRPSTRQRLSISLHKDHLLRNGQIHT